MELAAAEQELQQSVKFEMELADGGHPEYQALMDSIRRDVASLGKVCLP